MRLHGLALKEIKQIIRDPSAILIAFLMPVVLLIVNGFGINFDANHMKVAVVLATPGQTEHGLIQALAASPYLDPIALPDAPTAEAALIRGDVRGMLVVRDDFTQRLARRLHWPATAELAVNATDPNSARILEGYVSGALGTWMAGQASERRLALPGGLDLQYRYWFNPELRSADAVVTGIIAMVMTMTGTLLTALIVAREWERGIDGIPCSPPPPRCRRSSSPSSAATSFLAWAAWRCPSSWRSACSACRFAAVRWPWPSPPPCSWCSPWVWACSSRHWPVTSSLLPRSHSWPPCCRR